MYRPKQLSFPGYPHSPTAHGGTLSTGKRKSARPLCVRRPLHVVMRAPSARGAWDLLRKENAKLLHTLLKKYSKEFDVRVYQFANVSNHCHFLVKAKTKEGFRNFLRVLAGQLAQRITKARPGRPLKHRFWELIAFTRIIEWGRAYTHAKNYLYKNILQATRSYPFVPIRE
jgi:putative transposase